MTEIGIARIAGGGLVLLAALGFLSGGTSYAAGEAAPRLGLLPVGHFMNFLHLALGAWGLRASRSTGSARTYLWLAAVAFAGMGLGAFLVYYQLVTLELITTEAGNPIWSSDVWLHLVLGGLLGLACWLGRSEARIAALRGVDIESPVAAPPAWLTPEPSSP